METEIEQRPAVVIAGAGVAGLCAATRLGRAGLKVVCIDPEPFPRARVGESLDWSAPELLADLGLARDDMVAAGIGTYKREIRAVTPRGHVIAARPFSWMRRWPFRFELTTLHLDRPRFDQRLYEDARRAGVTFVWDHVVGIDLDGDRVAGCTTRSGRRYVGLWFIDASGRRRVLARRSGTELRLHGAPRVALWTQIDGPMVFEGTALYVDTDHDDLMWAWEIPVAEHRQSIGVVMNLDRFRSIQGTRGSSAEIMIEVLARFDRFHRTSSHDLDGVRSRTYRPAVPSRVAGANWISIGEAAGFVDPLTSTGVTAALRHGAEAAAIIIEDGSSPGGTRRRLGRYDQRVRAMAGLYNLGIERLIYEPELRSALGTRAASVAYLIPGYITNALYARLEPTTRPRMLVLSMVLRAFRFWVRAWLTVARLAARTPHSLGTFGVER